MDFADKKYVLDAAIVDAAGAVSTPENAIMWGSWINTIINLLIVGLVMFMIVKAYNKTKKPLEKATAALAAPTQEELLTEIRDLLKK